VKHTHTNAVSVLPPISEAGAGVDNAHNRHLMAFTDICGSRMLRITTGVVARRKYHHRVRMKWFVLPNSNLAVVLQHSDPPVSHDVKVVVTVEDYFLMECDEPRIFSPEPENHCPVHKWCLCLVE
jgi:hypothetical protein